MWFNSLTGLWRRTPARAPQALATFRPAVEPLGERVMPSAATLIQPAGVGLAAAVSDFAGLFDGAAMVWPVFVVVGLVASPPPLTVNVTI